MWGEVLKTEDLFAKFLVEIASQVNQNVYTIWFSKIDLVSITDNLVTIKVPMRIHKEMLGETYQQLIKDTFFSLTGKEYEFKYLLEEEIEENNIPLEASIEKKEEHITWNTNLNSKFTFDNYVVGQTNRLAYITARAVAETPGVIHNPLFIYGRSGLGKTHLMQAIGNYITEHSNLKVLYTTSGEFKEEYSNISNLEKGKSVIAYANDFKNKYRNVDVLIIDDIQFLVDAKRTQEEFFYTFEYLHQANKQIIISSDKSPNDLQKIEERLRSRFMWGISVDIYPPNFELRCDIIRAKLKNTSINDKVNNDVIEYIANHCVNDVRHIEGTINRLLAYTAMMTPEKITLDFAVEALYDTVNTNIYVSNSIPSIQSIVADYFGIRVEDLKSKKRNSNIVRPRHIAMYLCRMETDETIAKIGAEFGGRDHSTVSTAIDNLDKDLKTDENLQKMLKEIKDKLK